MAVASVSIPNELKKQMDAMLVELDKRSKRATMNRKYLDGCSPLPPAIVKARVTKAYRNLMPVAEAPWASLVVDSTQDRLEISGIKSEDTAADEAVWGAWQDNQLDAESQLALHSTLVDGRSFALVWRPPGSDGPEVSLDNASTMIVMYEEGSRRRRQAALRRWCGEDDRLHLTVYRRDYVFKFSEAKEQTRAAGRVKAGGTWWEVREDDEEWPLKNPYGVVPVVEIAINRRLEPGCFAIARGEYEHCFGLIDRINLLTFLGLVVAFWMGFPLRGVIGEAIKRDDDAEIIPPFDAYASGVVQLENANAKTFEFAAADRKNLFIFPELDQFSTITKTPRHYFPLEQGMSNLAADAIRASEGSLHAKCFGYKGTTSEGFEEILRLCGSMLDSPVVLSPRAALQWIDHESRSLAEKADAASKLKDILPWQLLGAKVLGLTQEEIARGEAAGATNIFSKLLAEAQVGKNQEVEPATA